MAAAGYPRLSARQAITMKAVGTVSSRIRVVASTKRPIPKREAEPAV